VQEHSLCMGCDDANVVLNHAILPVSTDATKRMVLTMYIKVLGKVGRGEDTIIGMNVFDSDIKACSIIFVSFLGLNCFLGSCSFLEMAIEELAVMIGPEGAILVLPIGGATNLKRYMSPRTRNHVID